MRLLPLVLFSLVTLGLILLLNTGFVTKAPLGKLLSPQHGIWQNAEDSILDLNSSLEFSALNGRVDVYLDDRLVPHVFAENENNVYFVQGFLHAKFRLWQMELQTYAAAGRAAEFVGSVAFNNDRELRRLGMVWAAEASLKKMEADAATKIICDQYTAGVNAYINTLTKSSLPLEYKLLGYHPQPWSNLKTALFMKYMSHSLASREDDFEMTNANSFFSQADFKKLYPLQQDSLDPVIPAGTKYGKPSVTVIPPADADSIYVGKKDTIATTSLKPDAANGSNNWAVSGSKTQSGAPILCNDPHLGLNLPSLWFEIQLSTPTYNVYGASFPGAPGVVIGYNDSCAWGVTNGGRDVKDYYEIKFKDKSRREYWLDSAWQKTRFRYEKIVIKDSITFTDTVAYTVFGPVMYDTAFSGNRTPSDKYFAVRWKAHDPSNELKAFVLLNKATNYDDYLSAISFMENPGQNFVFASKAGDIAMRTAGSWPAKWKGQGDFVMPGTTTSYNWQGIIPPQETPSQYNPERAFVSSANQYPADSSYPYYLGRGYTPYRGIIINRRLQAMANITPDSMMALQTDHYNIFAEMATPLFVKYMRQNGLSPQALQYFRLLQSWDYNNSIVSKGATVFAVMWKHFSEVVYDDEFANAPSVIRRPYESTLLEAILKDTAYQYLDNINTSDTETIEDKVTAALKNAVTELNDSARLGKLEWGKFKSTTIKHLLRLGPFGRKDLPVGGGLHCINATKENHGPSWRMIVHLTPQTEAYGVYPGGQSGNPGSRFYDNFIDKWVAGKYYPLWMMAKGDVNNKRIQWKLSFSKP